MAQHRPRAWGLTRRQSLKSFAYLFASGMGLSAAVTACSSDSTTSTEPQPAATEAKAKVLRIGHQKFDPFILIKARGGLEERLKTFGTRVEWIEFQSGPPLLEALNVGSIDIGRTGDAPPIFAQAADTPFFYVGSGAPRPKSSAVVVQADSPVQTLADLKGKKVGFQRGSSAHFLVVQALKKAGLAWSDIEPVNLTPADARSAFEQNNIDAWGIWDPFYAASEKQVGARTLTTGEELAPNREFFLASKAFVADNEALLVALLEDTAEVAQWADNSPAEVVEVLAPITGLEPEILDVVTRRRSWIFDPVQADAIAEQQRIADAFYELELIPKAVRVQDVIWTPSSAASARLKRPAANLLA
ncbi:MULTISPECIES: sulfonate ABC transporter substrate-binding protein [Cyanophyceae]|uniref:Sulfonate ABC transporter substrate-binding protein n=1 Tax=Leptolyngbya subtilissima DQ-A4 TaxID=2933933 RepID=A0ABV0KAP9_9CYAN|nr:sulfonate ABC transporter substrate-binding protein [Nodosilinea sp. FACHB-141]MBD2111806.1 sulfonate ABC transporter substrate-binding protein [Nodosilinea sp. FACHB-141]